MKKYEFKKQTRPRDQVHKIRPKPQKTIKMFIKQQIYFFVRAVFSVEKLSVLPVLLYYSPKRE